MLADLLTLHEAAAGARPDWRAAPILPTSSPAPRARNASAGLAPLRPLTIAYVGDPANVLHDMLVAYPRLGHTMRVASPPAYRAPAAVWDRLTELGIADAIHWSADPAEAVRGADIVVTDTWISMGQEAEKAERLRAFQGYQITEALCANAAPNWAFMHCLPRKPNEVDDEVCVPPLGPFFSHSPTGANSTTYQVFYGPRSLVFPVSDNRKWTIMALFECVPSVHSPVPSLIPHTACYSAGGISTARIATGSRPSPPTRQISLRPLPKKMPRARQRGCMCSRTYIHAANEYMDTLHVRCVSAPCPALVWHGTKNSIAPARVKIK